MRRHAPIREPSVRTGRMPTAPGCPAILSWRVAGGMFLLEALVAILVFALGTLGVFALAGHALRESSHAHWRIDAADLASSIVARMLTEDPATLALRYDPATNGEGFQDLLAAAERLPGVTGRRNSPAVTFQAGPSAGSVNVSLTLFWQAPGDALPHRHFVAAVVAR